MDNSFKFNPRLDLSFILASPKTAKKETKIKSNLDQMDQILKNINKYNTTKVDLEEMNREAKLEAKKGFYEEIDGLKLIANPSKIDMAEYEMFGFNKICSQIKKGLNKKNNIFKNQPFVLFKRDDFYGDLTDFSEKKIKELLLGENDKLKLFKFGLKLISVETNLDNILVIKKVLIDEMISVSMIDFYATLIKILINYGIDLDLLDRYVIKYRNIKNSFPLKNNQTDQMNSDEIDLNMIQSFVHIVDIIEISINSIKIEDHQIVADYISIVLILFSERNWRVDLQCLSTLAHLFVLILKRIYNSASTIKIVTKTISRFFKNKNSLFIEFLDFFPDNTINLSNIKFALCKTVLTKYGVKVGHNEERIKITFDKLKELKSINTEEMKLIITLIDHFYKTRELSTKLSQQISDCLSSFAKDYEFDSENKNCTEFRAFLRTLVQKYDKKPKETPRRRKKIKGENQGRPRKIAINSTEVRKIWDEFEDELNN